MAHIRKLKNDTYQATIYTGINYQGKKMYKYITCESLKECRDKVKEAEYEIQAGLFVNVENVRLTDYLDKWVNLNSQRLSPTTMRVYKIYIEKKFKPNLGHLKMNQITSVHIKEFYNEMLKVNKSKTVLKYHCVLNDILEEALKSKNPCRDVKAPKKEKYMPRILTEHEFSKLRNIIKGTDDELPILMAAWLGMRLGEVFGLRWKDINFKTGLIRICQNQVRTGPKQYVFKSPKSESGKRELKASEYIISLLKAYKASKKVISELVFDQKPDAFSKHFERILKSNGLPKTRFHDLRHYNATAMFRHGIPDLYASKRLGHASISTTKEIYQHITDEMRNQVEERIGEIFG